MAVKNISHPYYPRDLHLPLYSPNDKSMGELLGVFFAVVAVFMGLTWVYAGRSQTPKFGFFGKSKLCWFTMCALIHTVLEGYFSVYHASLVGEQSFLAQMWKEYGKGDSRYVSSDTFTVCMESITGFVDGPLSFLALYSFLANKPYRHPVQLILSLCQLYGDVLYFSTEIMDNFIHGELWHPIYFWFYFVFMNAIWIIIPSMCIVESWRELSKAQVMQDTKSKVDKKKK